MTIESSSVLEVITDPTPRNIDELVTELGATALLRDAHGGDWKGRPYLHWNWGTPEEMTCRILVGPHRGVRVAQRILVISEADAQGIIAQAQARQPRYAGQEVHVQRVSDRTPTEGIRLGSYEAV